MVLSEQVKLSDLAEKLFKKGYPCLKPANIIKEGSKPEGKNKEML